MPTPEYLNDVDLSDLPAEYLDTPLVQESKGISGIIKQAVDYQRLSGEQVRVPSAESDPTEWEKTAEKLAKRGVFDNESIRKAFQSKMGVPESADKYDIKVETLPENVKLDDEKLAKWRETFKEAGMSNDQANKMLNAYGAVISEQIAAEADKAGARDGVLKEAFGQAYDAKMAQVFNAVGQYGDAAAIEAVKSADPAIVTMLAKIADVFKVNGDGSFTSQGNKAMLSPSEAKTEWAEIQPKLRDRSLPQQERDRLMQRSVELQDLMNGVNPLRAA